MRWTEEHDILLLREILLYEPYNQRKGSVERGKVWDLLAESLNKINNPLFRVTGRSIRDHLKTLIDNFKRKQREEEKASGINPDETELDIALRDIIDRFNEAETEHSRQVTEKKVKQDNDVKKAMEMRKRSMETLSESMERSPPETTPAKKTRNNGSDTISYLKEKSSMELQLREKELEEKQSERKENREMMRGLLEQQQAVMKHMSDQQTMNMAFIQQQMQQQQQQMQQQQNMFITFMQAMQNQK